MLKDQVKPGDILLSRPRNLIGNIIAKFQMGNVNHSCIVYDSETVFETDGSYVTARFSPIEDCEGRDLYIVRANYMQSDTARTAMRRLCHKYEGRIYSYWDIVTNVMFFFLAKKIRRRAVKLCGTKFAMICSELVARIFYEVSGNKIWKDYEGMTPVDIKQTAYLTPELHLVYLYEGLSKKKE